MGSYLTARRVIIASFAVFVANLPFSGTVGAVTDTVFKYSTPQTGYYGLDPSAFAPQQPSSTYAIGDVPASIYDTSGSLRCFSTGVNLPQGAKMTALAIWYSSDTSGNVNAWLARDALSNGRFDYVAQVSSTDITKSRQVMKTAIGSKVGTVDNQLYTYYAGVCFGTSGPNSRYYGGRIAFTYGNAGD